MAEVLLFHHAQGRTAGVVALATDLERAGHAVHVPDLYEGRTFDDLQAGVEHLFADDSLPSFDGAATTLLTERMITFMASVA